MSLYLQIINSVASALIGGLAVAFLAPWLSSRWSRRNWQLQKAAEAYVGLFPEGRREIAFVQHIAVGHAFDMNPDESIESSSQKLGAKIDSRFLRYLDECWLLEREAKLGNQLDAIRKGYEKYRLYAKLQAELTRSENVPEEKKTKQFEKYVNRMEKEIDTYTRPNGEELLSQLDELREVLAKKYFH